MTREETIGIVREFTKLTFDFVQKYLLNKMNIPAEIVKFAGSVDMYVDGQMCGSYIVESAGHAHFIAIDEPENCFYEPVEGAAAFGISDFAMTKTNRILFSSKELTSSACEASNSRRKLPPRDLALLLLVHEVVHACMLVGQSSASLGDLYDKDDFLQEWISIDPISRMRKVHESFAMYVTEKLGKQMACGAVKGLPKILRGSTMLYFDFVQSRLDEGSTKGASAGYFPYFSTEDDESVRELPPSCVWAHQIRKFSPSFMNGLERRKPASKVGEYDGLQILED